MDWFSRAFLKASLAWFGIGVTLGAVMSSWPHAAIYRTAHFHMNLLGFVSMMIFGVAYHVIPRFMGHPLHDKRLAAIHFWVANLGLATLSIGFALIPTSARAPTRCREPAASSRPSVPTSSSTTSGAPSMGPGCCSASSGAPRGSPSSSPTDARATVRCARSTSPSSRCTSWRPSPGSAACSSSHWSEPPRCARWSRPRCAPRCGRRSACAFAR
ncbi:MAG: cbb3-type cytochrome c oxidase subunit I [Gemmatimonadetes bacterium]|nr:cbb3-type cytochrome c oxidase subunit I [Gemmatimonadota bacterium]